MKNRIPFNAPPSLALLVYFVCILCTGVTIFALDPMQELLKLSGTLDHLDAESMDLKAKSIMGVGASTVCIAGAICGSISEKLGPRSGGILGMVLNIAGYALLFLTQSVFAGYVGAVCLGTAFQMIFVSHLSTPVLFPGREALILAVLGAAPDLSLSVPSMLLSMAQYRPVSLVVLSYIVLNIGVLILDALFLPAIKYENEDLLPILTEDYLNEQRRTSATATTRSSVRSIGHVNPEGVQVEKTLLDQVLTWRFMIFIPYFLIGFVRRKYYCANIRGFAPNAANLFNAVLPFGFLTAIVWGAWVDKVGITTVLWFSHGFGCLAVLLIFIPSTMLHLLSAVLLSTSISYLFGSMWAYLALNFGFDNLQILQGIVATVTGVVSILQDVYWGAIYRACGTYAGVGVLMTVLGALGFITPLLYTVFPKKKIVLE